MKFSDILQMTKPSNYRVNVGWKYLKKHIGRDRNPPFDINPDFQRGHVWTKEQKIAYVEFKLKGGSGSDIIQTNCPGWMNDFRGPYVLVDGKQRLTAVLDFLDDKLPVFNHYYSEFEGRIPHTCDFIWCVNDLETKKEVLAWYVELNTGGTLHTKEEIDKVLEMIRKG
jgi:hypothetical protein